MRTQLFASRNQSISAIFSSWPVMETPSSPIKHERFTKRRQPFIATLKFIIKLPVNLCLRSWIFLITLSKLFFFYLYRNNLPLSFFFFQTFPTGRKIHQNVEKDKRSTTDLRFAEPMYVKRFSLLFKASKYGIFTKFYQSSQ